MDCWSACFVFFLQDLQYHEWPRTRVAGSLHVWQSTPLFSSLGWILYRRQGISVNHFLRFWLMALLIWRIWCAVIRRSSISNYRMYRGSFFVYLNVTYSG